MGKIRPEGRKKKIDVHTSTQITHLSQSTEISRLPKKGQINTARKKKAFPGTSVRFGTIDSDKEGNKGMRHKIKLILISSSLLITESLAKYSAENLSN